MFRLTCFVIKHLICPEECPVCTWDEYASFLLLGAMFFLYLLDPLALWDGLSPLFLYWSSFLIFYPSLRAGHWNPFYLLCYYFSLQLYQRLLHFEILLGRDSVQHLFISIWRNPASISYTPGLVVMNLLSSYLSGKVFISSSFLKDSVLLATLLFIDSFLVPFHVLNTSSPYRWPAKFLLRNLLIMVWKFPGTHKSRFFGVFKLSLFFTSNDITLLCLTVDSPLSSC